MPHPRGRSPRSGLALILVLTVILSLVVIATPFVLSMIMLEKTASAERARRQAGWGAEGVRNFAVSQLYRGAEFFERRDGGTPYIDERGEFEVEIRDARLKDLKVRDPKGNIWGVTAQDEQGKINVTSAPEDVVLRLRTNMSQRVVDLKDVLTIYSGRPAHWVRPQKIRELGTIQNPHDPTGTKLNGIRVDNAIQLGLGAKLRVTKPGLPDFETKVVRNGLFLINLHAVETDPVIPGKYLNGLVEVEMRHPVNLNTARRETLRALYEGLVISIPTGTGFKKVTASSEDARTIADGLYQKSVQTWFQFMQEALNINVQDELKAAIILNAIDPGNLLLNNGSEGCGSLPFCFSSNETITIEAMAAVNSDAGTPQGGAHFREVVDLGCPTLMTRSWENQHDFDRMMGPPRILVSLSGAVPVLPKVVSDTLGIAGLIGNANSPSGYLGYPFGARMETFPKDLYGGEPSDMTLKAAQGKALNFISMRTERDYRGQGGIFHTIEHFDGELEGRTLDGSAHMMEHARVLSPQPQRADTSAGGTEFWIKFDQSPATGQVVKLFDIREADASNRISVEVIATDIIFRLTDATQGTTALPLDKGWSEIRAPFSPEKDTWYHIAAYWKGTKYGQMLLMIDGYVPSKAKWRHVDDTDVTMSTELSSQLPRADASSPFSSVPLKDTSFLQKPATWPRDEPWTVPLQVGHEVIDYDPTTNQGRRGSRAADTVYGHQSWDHPQDAKVTVFGYTSVFRDMTVAIVYQPPAFDPPAELYMRFGPLVQTQGKTTLAFGIPVGTTLVAEDTDPDGNMVLLAQTTTIKYQISDQVQADSTHWPDSGFIKINDEAIFYRSINRTGPKNGTFEFCERGKENTIPANQANGSTIELWSIAMDTLDNRMTLPTIVQIGQEWFGPVNHPSFPVPVPQQFWIGCVVNGRAVTMMRGQDWMTIPVVHQPDEPLMPVFCAREVDTQLRRTNLGRYDGVTCINSDYKREAHIVCHSLTIEELNQFKYMLNPAGQQPPPPPRFVPDQGVQLATMFEQAREYFGVDNLFGRILKWPSGELIDQRWLALQNPSASYGPAKAKIDELKNTASFKASFALNQTMMQEVPQLDVTNVPMLNTNQLTSGIVLAGEEIIGFAEYDGNGGFRRCKRGWLNSTATVHNEGDQVFIVTFLPVAALQNQQLAEDARIVPITQILAGQGYFKGYVLVGDEVIGFEDVGLNGRDLDTLARFEGTGLFRGMFGTTPRQLPAHSMVFGIPFRYWDGFKRGQFDNRMPYFEVAHGTRDARWSEMRTQIEMGSNDPNLVPHSILRFDGLGDFTRPQVDDHSSVWHFVKNQTNSLDKFISSRQDNGQMEARFFLEYKAGSYWPANSWKRTMKFHEVRLDYDRDTRVLFHEEK